MKTKIINLVSVAFIIATVLSFTGCKKYDEGPAFSLSSKKVRVAGTWKFKSFIDNGNDDTQYFIDSQWEFQKDGDFKDIENGNVYLGSWEFASDKEAIDLTYDGDTYRWNITRLTNKEMWLERNDSGHFIESKLSKNN